MKFLILSIFLLFIGSIYTISRKSQSMSMVRNEQGKLVQFNSPIFQTFWLFFGQFLCLFAKTIKDVFTLRPQILKSVNSKGHYLAFFPAFFDVMATILDTIGLFYTHVSISQMLKSFLIIFTYLISKVYFKRNISQNQGCGIIFVFVGVGLIGFSNLQEHVEICTLQRCIKEASNPLLGNSLCILAQVFIALMFITEETIMKDFKLGALSLVGWEGLWGSLVTACFLSLLYYFPDLSSQFKEDFSIVTQQVISNDKLFLALSMSALSIGPFNFLGSKITKMSTALHRSALDSLRMLCVWCFSLGQAWEQFRWMQAFGFLLVTTGVMLIGVTMYVLSQYYKAKDQEAEPKNTNQKDYSIIDDVEKDV